MSWTHYSKGAILGVLLAISLVAVGTAGAVSFDGEPPAAKNVNDTAEMNATVNDPFEGQPETWTLRGETELENASWTVQVYEQGSRLRTETHQGTLEEELDSTGQATPDRVVVQVTGDVPDDIQYNYEDKSSENYTVISLENANSGEELQSYDAHRHTDGSKSARTAIQDAEAAIDELDNPSDDAQNQLDRAISSYDNGNFENARSLAEDAQSNAEEQQSSSLPLPLIGGAVVLVLLVVGGGAYYYKSQQSETHKLQ